MRGKDAELMLPVFLDDTHFGGTDALVDSIQFVGVTTAVTITTTRPTGTSTA
jgi:hypothetical protein